MKKKLHMDVCFAQYLNPYLPQTFWSTLLFKYGAQWKSLEKEGYLTPTRKVLALDPALTWQWQPQGLHFQFFSLQVLKCGLSNTKHKWHICHGSSVPKARAEDCKAR